MLRRAPALLAALALVSALGQVASAEPGTREKLEAAEHELERLDRIVDQKAVLGRLSEEIAVAYGRWEVANAHRSPRSSRPHASAARDAQEEYQALQGTLEERPARPTSSGRAASSSSSWARARSRTCRRGWST